MSVCKMRKGPKYTKHNTKSSRYKKIYTWSEEPFKGWKSWQVQNFGENVDAADYIASRKTTAWPSSGGKALH